MTCDRCPTPSAGVCCSSHNKELCHLCYRQTHFVMKCSASCRDCEAEGLPVLLERPASTATSAPRYRKKPVVVEAMPILALLDAVANAPEALPAWFRDARDKGTVTVALDTIFVNTLEGQICGNKTDWLIRGTRGELYPCKPDVFADVYEDVAAGEQGQEELVRYVRAVVESQKLGPVLELKDIATGLRLVQGPRAAVCQEAADLIDPPEEQL